MAAVGLSCIEWGSDVHAPAEDTERLHRLAALQKEYGIECCSYGTYFKFGKHSVDELEPYITAAKILGTDILRLWCGRKCGAEYTAEERQELIDQCKRASEIAETHGVTLCMECHEKSYTERLEDALELMREVASPRFRMYWQPSQWRSVAQNLDYASAIAPYTHHVHVFQWKGKETFSLNEGIAEWRGYLGKLPAPRTLLLEFMPDGQLTSLSTEADALRNIIGETI